VFRLISSLHNELKTCWYKLCWVVFIS